MDVRRPLLALGGGVLCALSLPPWGFWPLAFAGIALVDRSVAGASTAIRFRRGWLAGVGLLGPSTVWMLAFTPPGYVLQVVAFSALLGGVVASASVIARASAPPVPGEISGMATSCSSREKV